MAIRGASELAQEIVDYWAKQGKGRPLTVCIPGGTCSTAVLVNAALRDILGTNNTNNHSPQKETMDIRVCVIPCVGNEKYARNQMMSLSLSTSSSSSLTGGESLVDQIPTVLPSVPVVPRYFGQSSSAIPTGYFQFGEPNADVLATFREMEQYGVVLDLLYGAPSWTILLRHLRTEVSSPEALVFDPQAPLAGREIMYVHSGGLEGINSQLMRYKYKGLVEEVQLPGRP